MVSHHRYIRAPFLLQTDEHAHSDGVDASLTHAVEPVASPVEIRLHSAWVVDVVMRSVISLLEADHAVHSMVRELCIILGAQRHDLDFQVGEIFFRYIQRLRQVRHTCFHRVFSRDYQQVLERCQLLDGLVLILALLRSQDDPLHRIACVESAINAGIDA